MRSHQLNKSDPELLFAWECPILFKDICQKFSEFSNKYQKMIILFSEYKTIFDTLSKESLNLKFSLKLKKNNRFNSKSFMLSIQREKENTFDISQKLNNDNIKMQTNINENIEGLLYIDYTLSKNEDIFFELKSRDVLINYPSFSFIWTIKQFSNENLYLNGRNEKILRIKISDLLIGNNEIICQISVIKRNQTFKKIYNYYIDRNPHGGNCLVSPKIGISLITNFTIIQEGWKGGAMPLLFKIKYKTKKNILLDISNGGFFTEKYNINFLPEGNNNLFLEVSDNQGRINLSPCSVNVMPNKNQESIENYLTNISDISQKMLMMDIYTSNYKTNQIIQEVEKNQISQRLDILDSYYKEILIKFDPEKFVQDYDKLVSFLMELSSKNLKDINLQNLLDVLNFVINNSETFLDDLNKISFLYKIIDNFSENIKIQIRGRSGNIIKIKFILNMKLEFY